MKFRAGRIVLEKTPSGRVQDITVRYEKRERETDTGINLTPDIRTLSFYFASNDYISSIDNIHRAPLKDQIIEDTLKQVIIE